jgi:hypothetical protein
VPVELIAANAVMDSETGRLEKIVSDRGERFLDIAWPIFGGRAGMLRIGFSEEPYRKKVGELWFQMSLITLGILAVSLVAGQIFVFRLTRPLLRLADQVENIGEDNLALPAWSKAGPRSTAWPPPSTTCWSASKDYRRLRPNGAGKCQPGARPRPAALRIVTIREAGAAGVARCDLYLINTFEHHRLPEHGAVAQQPGTRLTTDLHARGRAPNTPSA